MKQKKQLFLSILLILGIALCLWTGRDRKPDPLPQASRPGTVTLASNGCCFWAENIRGWTGRKAGRWRSPSTRHSPKTTYSPTL